MVEQPVVLVPDLPEAAVTAPTHAFIGYDRTGMAVELLVDDGTRATRREAAKYVAAGGRVERMPIEHARKVRLYELPEDRR